MLTLFFSFKLRRGRDRHSEKGGLHPGKETLLHLNILKIVYSGKMVQGEQKKVGQILGEVMKFCEKIAVEGKNKLKYSCEFKQLMLETEVGASYLERGKYSSTILLSPGPSRT